MSAGFIPPPSLRPITDAVASLAAARGQTAYVVGGAVRDVLLGRAVADLDLAVGGDAAGFARALADALAGHVFDLDEERGVARIALEPARGGLRHVDVAALRGDIASDLHARDFTVDALAAPPPGGDVIDVCRGLGDLAAGLVRAVATSGFDADPLRLLRAVRIASELGFEIEEATRAAIAARTAALGSVAAERRRDELVRIFALPRAGAAVRALDGLGLLGQVLPELMVGRGVTQPPRWHAYDVLEHNVRALEVMDQLLAAPEGRDGPDGALAGVAWQAFAWREAELRRYFEAQLAPGSTRASALKLASLLHDVGKPATRAVDADGRIRFFGHAAAGAALARARLRALRYSSREREFVGRLVEQHLRPVQLAPAGVVPSRRAVYRFQRDLGEDVPAVLLLALADAAASRGPALASVDWERHVGYMNALLVRSLEVEGIVSRPVLVDGEDLVATLGLKPGPIVGRVLARLREAQALGDVTDRDEALALARRLAQADGEA